MAAVTFESQPQPGDGAWLTNIDKTGRGRGRRRDRKSASAPHGQRGPASARGFTDRKGKSSGAAGEATHQRQEQTSLQAGGSELNRGHYGVDPDSAHAPQSAMASGNTIPPHLRGKSIPPHLRHKHKERAASTAPTPDNAATTRAESHAESNSPPAQASSTTPPATVQSPRKASGLRASQDAPLSVRSRAISDNDDHSTTKKLWSVGAKVGEPKPLNKPALVGYESSEEAEASPTKATITSNRTKIDSSSTHANATATATGDGLDPAAKEVNPRSPTESFTHQPQKGTNNAQHDPVSQRGRGRGDRAPREARWPKNSEIPKGDPQRWAIKWDDNDDVCSVDSVRADSGWGESKKQPAVPAGIDPETGFLLTDFGGNWSPAPIDWDSRPAFRPQQSAETIEKWKQHIQEEMVGKTWEVPQSDLVAPDGLTYHFAPDPADKALLIQGDVAPRYWSPIVVGRESPNTFWKKLVASREPEPIDEEDLTDFKPWWETYEVSYSCSLRPYEHPETKGIQPTETQREQLRRENDNGSLHHAENRKRAEIAKKEADRERRKKAMEKARKLSMPCGSSREIKPGLTLYLRPARPEDIPRIKEIYNHYVEHTVCVPETERRKDSDMLQRYNDIITKKMPFLVACERGGVLKSRKRNHEPITLPEKLVGFAYADDHHDLKGMYRFTCDVEVYTDSTQYMKGIGKCLFDKLLGLLDSSYIERGGYGIEGAELEGIGPSRVVSNIVAAVPYEKDERLEWKRRFLNEFAGFKQVGLMEGIGNKLSQSVNVAIFQRKTGFEIDPANPPIMSEYTR